MVTLFVWTCCGGCNLTNVSRAVDVHIKLCLPHIGAVRVFVLENFDFSFVAEFASSRGTRSWREVYGERNAMFLQAFKCRSLE